MGDFRERLEALKELVGSGTLEGTGRFDQIYAAAQHEHEDWAHHTGKAMYLRDPLLAGQDGYYDDIADRLLEEGPVLPMIDAVKALLDEAANQAPKDISILARSGSGDVTDDGAPVWEQAAEVPRLTEDELYLLHNGKPDLHGAGRRKSHEVGGAIVGHPGHYANPNGPR